MEYAKKNQELHDAMLTKLKPLVDFLNAEGFGYWLTVGRKGQSANYCGGPKDDVVGAVVNLVERNPAIAKCLNEGLNESLN